MKDFFSKCDQIRSFLWIWSHFTEEICNEKLHFFAMKNPKVLSSFMTYKDFTMENLFDLKPLEKIKIFFDILLKDVYYQFLI